MVALRLAFVGGGGGGGIDVTRAAEVGGALGTGGAAEARGGGGGGGADTRGADVSTAGMPSNVAFGVRGGLAADAGTGGGADGVGGGADAVGAGDAADGEANPASSARATCWAEKGLFLGSFERSDVTRAASSAGTDAGSAGTGADACMASVSSSVDPTNGGAPVSISNKNAPRA